MDHSPEFLKLVNSIKPSIKTIELIDLDKLNANGQSYILIDVREDNEVAKGMLPNAIHLSKGIIERDIENRIPDKSHLLVLYCGGGFRSALACFNIQQMGYRNCYSLEGGYRAWQDRNCSS